MEYLVSFLEGIITFISPCLLPMLPLYLAYFAGDASRDLATESASDATTSTSVSPAPSSPRASNRVLVNAFGFVLGFTLVFVLMGAFASAIGLFLARYQTAINIISGIIVIVFGLNFMGVFNIGFLNRTLHIDKNVEHKGFLSAVLFGLIFAIGWTPCVGAFLGSALLLASQQASLVKGVVMLTLYSLGLGIPFVLSAVLIDKLEGAFAFIKRHYRVINLICGCLLVLVGLLMAFGLMGSWLATLSI